MTATAEKQGKYLIIPKGQDPEEGRRLCVEFRRHQACEVVTEPSEITGAFSVDLYSDDAASLQSVQITASGYGAVVWSNHKALD